MTFEEFVKKAIDEDVVNYNNPTLSGNHSIDCLGLGNTTNRARLIIKDEGIIAGVEIARKIFEIVDSRIEFKKSKIWSSFASI